MFSGDQMKAEADPLLDPMEGAAQANDFTHMELVATMPGVAHYAAMGYEVTK